MWIVTGASGFVGRHVLEEFGRRDVPAAGLYRKKAAGVSAAEEGGRRLDDWSRGALARAFAGARGVVHSASIVHAPTTPPAEYERFNVEGTRALLDAAEEVGVEKVVMISSIKVYGEHPRGVIDERTPVAPDAPYAETKVRAEQLVLAREALNAVVLRLCPVYGVGDKGNVRTMIRAIHRRRFLLPGSGHIAKSIVHVSTVARAVVDAALRDLRGTYLVADERAPTLRELADEIAQVLGRPRPLAIPDAVLTRVAGLVGRVSQRLGVRTNVSSTLIEKALTPTICNASKLAGALGVRLHADLRTTLQEEVDWLRAAGAL